MQLVRILKLFTVSYYSVGCIPDSDFWPVEIETLDEVIEFLLTEVSYLDIELGDSREFRDMLDEIYALTEQGGIIEEIGDSLYRYSIERVV